MKYKKVYTYWDHMRDVTERWERRARRRARRRAIFKAFGRLLLEAFCGGMQALGLTITLFIIAAFLHVLWNVFVLGK